MEIMKPPDPPMKTFASIVAGTKKDANIELKTPSTYKGEPAVYFSEEEIQELASPFKYALIGKFPRGRPNMEIIRKFFIRLALKTEFKIGLIDSNHILIHLQDEDDYHRIWLRNQWNIMQYPMQITKWHVNFTPENESPIMPVWVSMPYLPAHLFRIEAIISIARTIGTPMRIDASTANLVRPSKARVCVEVDLTKPLPTRTWVGQGKTGFWQSFTYEDKPSYCQLCNKVGHENNMCIMSDETKHKEGIEAQNKANGKQIVSAEVRNKTTQQKPKAKQQQIYIQKSKQDLEIIKSTGDKASTSKSAEPVTIAKDTLVDRTVNTADRIEINTVNRIEVNTVDSGDMHTRKEVTIEDCDESDNDEGKIENIPRYSILKRGTYSMPESFKHLLKDTESFAKNFNKRCAETLTYSDDENHDNRETPTLLELQDFSRKLTMPKKPNQEEQNQEPMIGDDDGFKMVYRRKKNYIKNPELQRATRSTARVSKDVNSSFINV